MNRLIARVPETLALNLLRIVTGFLFMQHGAQKLFGVLGREEPVQFFTQLGLAGVLEFVGGLLVMVGLFTRPVAFILSGEMAWAYFQAHAPNGFWPIMNRGELAALYSFVFLYLALRGGGSLSVDGVVSRFRRGEPTAAPPPLAPEPPPGPEASVGEAPPDVPPEPGAAEGPSGPTTA